MVRISRKAIDSDLAESHTFKGLVAQEKNEDDFINGSKSLLEMPCMSKPLSSFVKVHTIVWGSMIEFGLSV